MKFETNEITDGQRNTEWYQARLGRVTASPIWRVLKRLKSGTRAGQYAQDRYDYMLELAGERVTGIPADHYQTKSMEWGTMNEDGAAIEYTKRTGNQVMKCGFFVHPLIPGAGASPDGLVGHDGLIEIKCLNTDNHLKILLTGEIPDKYYDQMQWQMACTGRLWVDFVSYDPRVVGPGCLYKKRIDVNEPYIQELETEVLTFLAELDSMVAKINGESQIGVPAN